MVDVPTIIGIIILVVVAIVILKIVKKAVKAIAIVTGLIFIILIVVTYLVYLDLDDIQENLGTTPSLFVYQDSEGDVLTGVHGAFGEEKEVEYVNSEILNSFEDSSLKDIKGEEYYKIFIFEQEAFDPIETIEDFAGKRVSKTDAIFLIQSDDFMTDVTKTNLNDFDFENVEHGKGIIFGSLFKQGIKQDKIFLFRQYKKGNVKIYPETIVFRIIKSVPNAFVDKIIKVEGTGKS